METKKLGFLIIGISIVLGFFMFSFMNKLSVQGEQLNCNPTQECRQVNSVLGVSHMAVGFLAFIFALGFYLLFFNKDEKEILEKYGFNQYSNNKNPINYNFDSIKNENNIQNNLDNGDKFSLMLKPLDENEKKVLLAVREQGGITQSTLRFRTDLSKATISQILTDFERKNLIERKAKGKTYSVFLAENF
jgi:hypothetical protein